MYKMLIAILAVITLFGCDTMVASKNENTLAGKAPVTVKTTTGKQIAEKVDNEADKNPERDLAYRGETTIITDKINETSKAIREETKNLGGYLYTLTSNSLDLRIPSSKLETFMAGLVKYGKIKSSRISAEDVTDTNIDLQVRIENLEKLRQRLLSFSDKSQKVEETLKVEKELARITAELETLKSMLRRSSETVKYSRLFINLTLPVEEIKTPFKTPFVWVNYLTTEIDSQFHVKPYKASWWTKNIETDLPQGFAEFYNNKDNYWAINGTGAYYHIYIVKNEVEKADAKFWQQVVKKYLDEGKGHSVLAVREVETKSGKGFQISTTVGTGTNTKTYVVQVVAEEEKILVSEFWGITDNEVLGNQELIMQVLKSVKTSL